MHHNPPGPRPIHQQLCGEFPSCGGKSGSHRKIRMLYERHNGRCVYCDGVVFLSCNPVTEFIGRHAQASVDHVIPKSRGGVSLLTNLVLACKVCNEAKSDSLDYA